MAWTRAGSMRNMRRLHYINTRRPSSPCYMVTHVTWCISGIALHTDAAYALLVTDHARSEDRVVMASDYYDSDTMFGVQFEVYAHVSAR